MYQASFDIDFSGLPADIADGFWEFHRENPHVYDRLQSMALDIKSKGQRKIGMAMLFEVLRWEFLMSTVSDEQFKLNNNYKAYYSRLLESSNAALEGMFTKRSSDADKAVH